MSLHCQKMKLHPTLKSCTAAKSFALSIDLYLASHLLQLPVSQCRSFSRISHFYGGPNYGTRTHQVVLGWPLQQFNECWTNGDSFIVHRTESPTAQRGASLVFMVAPTGLAIVSLGLVATTAATTAWSSSSCKCTWQKYAAVVFSASLPS